ncbi:MAG: signal peptidase II, partial [Prevotellaceae bacterium]|nr:signal peptidase II [Prevotellaceae bacterium]
MSKRKSRLTISRGALCTSIILLVLVIDQIIKVSVKLNMLWRESIHITDWFYLYFTENNGMAFGMEIFGKLFLTSFRIIAVAVIGYVVYKLVKQRFNKGFLVCASLILAGALGNIIDSVFYGVLFSESTQTQLAEFL